MNFHVILPLVWITAVMFTVCRAGSVREHSACYVTRRARNCSTPALRCPQGKSIFIVNASRGFKHKDFGCNSQRDNCANGKLCCTYNSSDCMKQYKRKDFFTLTNECLRLTACNYSVPEDKEKPDTCGNFFLKKSGYSSVHYLCLEDSSITSFSTPTNVLGSAIAVIYNQSQDSTEDMDRKLTCQVEAVDCGKHQSSVLLYKSRNKNSKKQFTSLRVNDGDWLAKSKKTGVYRTSNAKTPFNVSLRIVHNNNADLGVAVIYAETKMRVTCGASGVAFPSCIVPTYTAEPTKTTASTQSREITATTIETLISGENTPAFSSRLSTTLPLAEPTSDGVGYSGIQDKSGDVSSNEDKVSIVGVAAGSVGALLFLAAAVAIATVCYRRRRAAKDTSTQVLTAFKGSGHSTSGVEAADVGLRNPAVSFAGPDVSPALGQATSGPADCPPAGNDNSESDYDHLGCKRPSPTPRGDALYGHLSSAGDVTESDYDHMVWNRKSASDDVVDNTYDTTKPATTARRDDDEDYNVLGASGSRQEVVNNIYDIAGPPPAMGADDVNYNALGASQSPPDVINNIYDTADAV